MRTWHYSRRTFCRCVAAAGLVTCLPGKGRATNIKRTLDLADPADALTAMIKMRGSLVAEDVPHWYCGTIYAVQPGKPPLPDGSPAEDKIAAIGVRLRRWVSFHGVSINVDPDLSHYDGIVPCGIAEHGVTSLVDLGLPAGMADLDLALRRQFVATLGAL